MTTNTQTALMERQRHHALAAAMHQLLHELRQFMRVEPMRQDVEMPEHELVWVSNVDSTGPQRTILDAIKRNPILLREVLPEDACIVPRSALKRSGLSEDTVNELSYMGGHLIETHAARLRYENELAIRR